MLGLLPPRRKSTKFLSKSRGWRLMLLFPQVPLVLWGRGSPWRLSRASKSSLDKVRNMIDGVGDEVEEVEEAVKVLDIESCHEDDLPKLISRYSNKPTTVPRA